MKYTYEIIKVSGHHLEDTLNHYGEMGYRVVQIIKNTYNYLTYDVIIEKTV